MKNQLQIQVFENDELGKVRVIEVDGQPWWVLKDICDVLDLSNSRMIADRLDEDDVSLAYVIDSIGRNQQTSVVNESGLYSVIIRSEKPNAKKFKRWITSDVLPSIRKHGAYMTDEKLLAMMLDNKAMGQLVNDLVENRVENIVLNRHIKEITPKVRYYDLILQCDSAIPVSVIAKDFGMTAITFNQLIHDFKIQYKLTNIWLLYNEYSGKGYTISKTFHVHEKKTATHTYWTQKGRYFLYEFLKGKGILPDVEKGLV